MYLKNVELVLTVFNMAFGAFVGIWLLFAYKNNYNYIAVVLALSAISSIYGVLSRYVPPKLKTVGWWGMSLVTVLSIVVFIVYYRITYPKIFLVVDQQDGGIVMGFPKLKVIERDDGRFDIVQVTGEAETLRIGGGTNSLSLIPFWSDVPNDLNNIKKYKYSRGKIEPMRDD